MSAVRKLYFDDGTNSATSKKSKDQEAATNTTSIKSVWILITLLKAPRFLTPSCIASFVIYYRTRPLVSADIRDSGPFMLVYRFPRKDKGNQEGMKNVRLH